MQICPGCGEENPARFRLCGFCGTPLAPAAPVQEVRKTVTIVFSDLKGSTDLGERLDSESLREVMNRYFAAMRAELEQHGGTIEKFIGDAIMAVFGLPVIHEDDALRAVRAAIGMRDALERLNVDLERAFGIRLANRTGVNTGEVIAGDPTTGQRLVTGDPVNTAARLEQAAPVNEILIGELTHRLVRDAVEVETVEPLELKGKSERVPAWRLLGLRRERAADSPDAGPMIGRDAEMRLLGDAFRSAASERRLRLVTLIGDAGVGKSRLTREFLGSIAEQGYVVRGKCLPYGRGITFWPLTEIVRRAAGVDEEDTPERAAAKLFGLLGDHDVTDRLLSVTGLSRESFRLEEVFWAVRRMIEILAEREPLVIVIDDIHWGETALLELIGHLAGGELSVPVLLLCTARHELLEKEPDWGEGDRMERIVLGPLGDDQAGAMVEALLGRSGLSKAIRDKVTASAQGIPLYVEQLVSMLVDEGVIRQVDGDWRLADNAGDVKVPPTINALLAARLDRLVREERGVVETASVIGQVFAGSALRHLAPEELKPELGRSLKALDTKQLVHALSREADGEARFRFHHILVRDAAYHGLLKRARATLHERFVEWADARNAESDRGLEFEEILGYHLEQAYRYLSELGAIDDHARSLGIKASVRLASAGRRAMARGDIPATASLLRRAAACRPVGDAQRARLWVEAGEALTQEGELAAADEALKTARQEAEDLFDPVLEATATLGLIYLHHLTGTEASAEEVVRQVRAQMRILEREGDDRGLARAWLILTNVHLGATRYLDATEAAEQMLAHARAAGDATLLRRARPALATCAQLGPTPVPEAIALVEGVLAELEGDRMSEAFTLRALANLEAMRGHLDEARTLYRRVRGTLEDLGWRFHAALTSVAASGPIELIADDAVAAEAELRKDHVALAAMGEQNYISTVAAFLAEALYRQDRLDEAYGFTEEAERIAAEDDAATQALWRQVRAKIVARRGDPGTGETLARTAIAIIEEAQDPESQGWAWLDLAEVLEIAGHGPEADLAAATAQDRFVAKGDVVSAARAGRARERIAAGAA
ncbi:MAG: adenylate/guanylate cyclase domain-containing protein [Chloroflexota bacterium]